MSLRLFHLFFISLSVVLAAFCAAWAAEMYRTSHDGVYVAAAITSVAAAAVLVTYGAAFQRKMRRL